MAKTIERKNVVVLPSRPDAVQPLSKPAPEQKSKAELAKEYLDKFHPGWDVYLKTRNS